MRRPHNRQDQLLRVLEGVIARREAGEVLSDDQVIADHPELLPELADELKALRAVDEAEALATAGSIAEASIPDGPSWESQYQKGLSAHLPGYEVSGDVHRGGQSVVYRAVQSSTRQEVAIKVMRAGFFADEMSKARFDREVYILGQFKHPNIVSIHDSGSVAGNLYFVMDYIRGKPIDAFASGSKLAVDDTLRLFSIVCDAVNVAHLRGVIHRDIKPSNILVDPAGNPHILDFGLAKVADTDDWLDGSSNVMTHTGQFVGSLPWASPEQAQGRRDEIDLRTDVYSLGVVLYQMLTGRFPYEVTGDMQVVLQNILNTTPDSPSRTRRQVGDEVETIVLKCLSKERDRRYQSAGELKRDIDRYLTGEPIEAKRDSVVYVLRKQVSKHKFPFLMAMAIVMLTTFSTIWLSFLYGDAKEARAAEADQRAKAVADREKAQASAASADRVSEFLVGLFQTANPLEVGGDLTARELLDSGSETILNELDDEPEARARLLYAMGRAYSSLTHYTEARPLLTESLELRRAGAGTEEELAESLSALGWLEHRENNYEAAEALHREALAISRELHGPVHRSIGAGLNALASIHRRREEFDQAESLFIESIDVLKEVLGDRHENVANVMHNLSRVYVHLAQYDEAEPLVREALAINREHFGERDPRNSPMLHTIARILEARRDYAGAEPLLREALEIDRAVLGNEHEMLATSLNNLGTLCVHKGDYTAARKYLNEGLAIQRKRVGNRHEVVAMSLANLGVIGVRIGDFEGAEPLFEESRDILREIYGDQHSTVAALTGNLAAVKRKLEDWEGAAKLYRQAMEIFAEMKADHPQVETSMAGLGMMLTKLGDPEAGEPYLREVVKRREAATPPDDWLIALGHSCLGESLIAQGRFEEAEPLVVDTFPVIFETSGTVNHYGPEAIARVLLLYEKWGKPEKVAEWQQEWAELTREE